MEQKHVWVRFCSFFVLRNKKGTEIRNYKKLFIISETKLRNTFLFCSFFFISFFFRWSPASAMAGDRPTRAGCLAQPRRGSPASPWLGEGQPRAGLGTLDLAQIRQGRARPAKVRPARLSLAVARRGRRPWPRPVIGQKKKNKIKEKIEKK